ncbi:MAG TPA: hypothetical protein VGQ09_23700 [Chitinophagaceae bacterium]|nr:hypothetical protein [Chitinophagaceae bacterium]
MTTALLIDLVYQLTRPGVIMQSPAFGIFIFILFFSSYFTHPILGLSLIRSLKAYHDVGRPKLILIRVTFFIQIIFQIIIAYNSIETIQKIILLLQHRSQLYSFYEMDLPFEIVAIILGLLTVYLEIFTFPLIKAVRKKYASIIEQIDELGYKE